MKTLKSISEGGFFKNIGSWCTPLTDFLKDCTIIKRKGKEYIIHHGLFFDLDDLKQTIYNLVSFKGRRHEKTGEISCEITIQEISWDRPLERPHIRIKYNIKTLASGTERIEWYTFDNIWGSGIDKKEKDGSTREYDQKLKKFIEE